MSSKWDEFGKSHYIVPSEGYSHQHLPFYKGLGSIQQIVVCVLGSPDSPDFLKLYTVFEMELTANKFGQHVSDSHCLLPTQ